MNKATRWLLVVCLALWAGAAESDTWNTTPGGTGIVTITSSTDADPTVVTATAHGLVTGEEVRIERMATETAFNGNYYEVLVVTANTFTMKDRRTGDDIAGSGGGAGSGGVATKIANSCTGAGPKHECYYIFTGTNDSEAVFIDSKDGTSGCFNPDTASETLGSTMRLMRVVTAATVNGSVPVLGLTMTGAHPAACIDDIPRGDYWVDIVTGPSSVTSVFRLGGN